MNKADLIENKLRDFNFNHKNKNSQTQKSGEITEGYTEKVISEIYDNSAIIFKCGSQQHPDFLLLSKKTYNLFSDDIKQKIAKKIKEKVSPKALIYTWAIKTNNQNLIVKIECKSSKKGKVYVLNDSFPHPMDDGHNTIYVMFDFNLKQTYINTSNELAKIHSYENQINIIESYKETRKILDDAQKELNKLWPKGKVSTKIRPTYSMKDTYCHFTNTAAVSNLLKKQN